MNGFESILIGMISFLPAVLIFVAVAVFAAKKLKERDTSSGKKYTQTSGGVQGYTPKEYSRETNAIQQADPTDNYQLRMEQLRALFRNGMMDQGEFEERKAGIEADYRQDLRMR